MDLHRHPFRVPLILLALSLTLTTFANAAAIDQKRMDRDLDIMEAVLGRLLV